LGSASKQGGPRDSATLYANLTFVEELRKGTTVVLVDDVMTSGGHLKACAAKIRSKGADVVLAICGGRTLYDQDKKAFDIVEEMLVDHKP
jgi:orotate phosphoribosyltransferase